jgi:hypothetical protein
MTVYFIKILVAQIYITVGSGKQDCMVFRRSPNMSPRSTRDLDF